MDSLDNASGSQVKVVIDNLKKLLLRFLGGAIVKNGQR